MHAAPKSDIPVADAKTLEQYDAFLFGIPTRYGNFPAQWKAFWDTTGGQWGSGAYWGKYAGIFVSSGTQGGGQESTALAAMSTLTHHGIIYVPLGYKTSFPILGNLSEIRGGSPWGAGTFAVSSLCPSVYRHCVTNILYRLPMGLVNRLLLSSNSLLFTENPLVLLSTRSTSD
jgi:multimeric flavodoxin WrbA